MVFVQDLRRAGLKVGVDRSASLARCVALVDRESRRQVHDAALASLVSRHEDQPVFERLFERFWPDPERREGRAQKAPVAPRHDRGAQGRPALVSYMAERAAAGVEEIERRDRQATWSVEERIQRREFVDMTTEELREVDRLLARIRWRAALRRTRRRAPRRRGESLDLRRVLAEAGRRGGQVLELPRRSRKIKPRPLVLLADISGSMELYSRLLMQFFFALGSSLPNVESFVFGTRLTRITNQLRTRSVDQALRGVSGEVIDWAGGTRIGDCLGAFNRVWSRRVLRRGAVVLIVSDGWDRGDAAILSREMRFIHDRAHRVIWLNPLLGQSGYQPLVEGMRAALPFVDDFLPIHNLYSLRALAEHLSKIPARRSAPSASAVAAAREAVPGPR